MRKEKRGKKEINWQLFLIIALTLFSLVFIVSVKNVNATNTPGICLSSMAIPSRMCEYVNDISQCCGFDETAQGYTYCNSTFIRDLGPGDIGTLTQCQANQGCCANMITSNGPDCQMRDKKAYCDEIGGVFAPGQACAALPQCTFGCCVWKNDIINDNTCKYVPSFSCATLNKTVLGLSGSHYLTFNVTTSQTACETPNYCDGISISQTPGTIIGKVINSLDAPIVGATVTTNLYGVGISAITNSTGEATLQGITPGYTTFWAYAQDYTTVSAGVNIPAESIQTVLFELTDSSTLVASLPVKVKDSSGYPIAGVLVEVIGLSSQLTDTNGDATFMQVPIAEQIVKASMFNYYDIYKTASPTGTTFPTINIELQKINKFNVSGSVIDFFNNPKPGRWITLDNVRKVQTTSPDGKFVIENVTSGTYRISVETLSGETASSYFIIVNQTLNNELLYLSNVATPDCSVAFTEYSFCNVNNQQCNSTQGPPNNQPTPDAPVNTVCCAGSNNCSKKYNYDDDWDGDGVPNSLDKCPYEPALINKVAATESNLCSNGIDDDCDSTGPGYGQIHGNKVDNLASVMLRTGFPASLAFNYISPYCQFCPTNICKFNSTNHSICDELQSGVNSFATYTDYNLQIPDNKSYYCSVCSSDPACKSECETAGKSCCSSDTGQGNNYTLSCDSSQKTCWDYCGAPATYICCQYSWSCDGESIWNDTVCTNPNLQYQCKGTFCQPAPYCKLHEPFNSTNNTLPSLLNGPQAGNNSLCNCNGELKNTNKFASGASVGYCCPTGVSLEYCPPIITKKIILNVVNESNEELPSGKHVVAYLSNPLNPWVRVDFITPENDPSVKTFGWDFFSGRVACCRRNS